VQPAVGVGRRGRGGVEAAAGGVDQLREAMQWVPFLGLINKQKVDGSMLQHPLTIRLAEAAIIGLVVMYGASQKVELKLTHLEGEIQKLP
jgi:hypothetical protein